MRKALRLVRLSLCLLAVVLMGTSAVARGGHSRGSGNYKFAGKGKSPQVYLLVEADNLSKSAEFDGLVSKAVANLVPFDGHLLASGETTALVGQASQRLVLIEFDNDTDVKTWRDSMEVKTLLADDVGGKVRMNEIKGLQNAAVALQASQQKPDTSFNTHPASASKKQPDASPNVMDICKGC